MHYIMSGIKFYIIMVLLAIRVSCLSDTKAESLRLMIYNKYNVRNFRLRPMVPAFGRTMLGSKQLQRCFNNNRLINCPIVTSQNLTFNRFVLRNLPNRAVPLGYLVPSNNAETSTNKIPANRRILDADLALIELDLSGKFTGNLEYPNLKPTVQYLNEAGALGINAMNVDNVKTMNGKKNEKAKDTKYYENQKTAETTSLENMSQNIASTERVETLVTTHKFLVDEIATSEEIVTEELEKETGHHKKYIDGQLSEPLLIALDQFQRKFYAINFDKFTTLSPASRGDSGMSFIQSGLFLEMTLIALSTEVDLGTKNEINENLGLDVSDSEKMQLIMQVIRSLPNSSIELKFHWSSRLVLRFDKQVSDGFVSGAADALQLKITHFDGNETPEAMAMVLNKMIETDSEGAIRDTFEEDDLTENVEAVLITTLYFRAQWRSAPTLLNGTRVFRDSGHAPRSVRMIRINDIMQYVDLPEWDAEAIQISYSTRGLSLLILVPRGNSLKRLVDNVNSADLKRITERMQSFRIAATLPLYTLRMTLLLPNKLQAMGISRLVDASGSESGSLRLSQAVQRIMFWAEAGRNAYKDDGFEWDEPPKMEIIVDRPYIFYVRWHNVTLMNGNFVL